MATTSMFQPAGPATLARLSVALDQAPSLEADRLYVPPGEGQAPVKRIVVLVPPDAGLDAELAERAWRLAAPSRLPVVLVGLAQDSASEAQRRRQLASLAALTRDEGVPVTLRLAMEQSWLPAVQALWRPGDLVVCFTGQMAPAGWWGLGRQPLHRALQHALPAPLYQARLSNDVLAARRLARPLAHGLALLSALVVIAACFWVQAEIVRATQGLAQSALLLMSVVLEFLMIRVISN